MEGLGRLFDIVPGTLPVDLATAATTGLRCHLKGASGCTVVIFKEVGAASEASTMTLKQHNASSSGTSKALATIDHVYVKDNATLTPDITWTKSDPASSSTVTPTSDHSNITVIEVDANSLDDGYEWISIDTSDTSTAGQIFAVLYLLHDLNEQRAPANLPKRLTN